MALPGRASSRILANPRLSLFGSGLLTGTQVRVMTLTFCPTLACFQGPLTACKRYAAVPSTSLPADGGLEAFALWTRCWTKANLGKRKNLVSETTPYTGIVAINAGIRTVGIVAFSWILDPGCPSALPV